MASAFTHTRRLKLGLVLSALLASSSAVQAETAPRTPPHRETVQLPPMVRDHFLAHMRDHLAAVSEIQSALAEGKFKQAGEIAKSRLGMDAPSSMACKPGMEHMGGLARFMPNAMREAGRTMHHAADQFAVDVKAADYRAAFASLSRVTAACVACHAKFKVSR